MRPLFILLDLYLHNILKWLNELDTFIFLKINTVYTNPILDKIYPWYREGNAWIPLYLFLILFMVVNFNKKSISWIVFAVITLILTDQMSSSIIKPFFERPRPCRDPILMYQVRLLLNNCSGGYSFTSSHATNHFGFVVFVIITIGHIIGKWKYLFILWAISISYGQIYVGVHYPFDIVMGGLIGSMIGWLSASFYIRRIGLPNFT